MKNFSVQKILENEKDTPLKRGRDSQQKTKIVVMAESELVEGKITKKGKPRKVGRLKMKTINDLRSDTIQRLM